MLHRDIRRDVGYERKVGNNRCSQITAFHPLSMITPLDPRPQSNFILGKSLLHADQENPLVCSFAATEFLH